MHEGVGEQKAAPTDTWKAWDAFLESETNTGFWQSSWYTGFTVAHYDLKNFGTVVNDRGAVVGGAMVLAHSFARDKCYYYITDGPVLLETESDADQEQVFRTIMEFIERKRRNEQQIVSHLCINPRWERVPSFLQGFEESSHYYGFPRDTQYIDLTPSECAILAQMKPKGRYNIGLAQRYGVAVVEDVSPQGIQDFVDICNGTFARKNMDGHDPEYFRALISMLSASARGSVFFAEYNGTRLATALVVYFGRRATYYYGGSRAMHRHVMAPYLLQFEVMRKAKVLGCQTYDLFGVNPKDGPRTGWTDISVFKRKFGGREVRLVPSLQYIYDQSTYEEWKAIEENGREREVAHDEADAFGLNGREPAELTCETA